MQVRCIAFLIPAAMITGLILLLTSSLGSVLDQRFIRSPSFEAIPIVRHETDCEILERRIERVAVDMRHCQALPGCLHSRNICPGRMLEQYTTEYAELRKDAFRLCREAPTYIAHINATCADGSEACDADRCGMTPASIDAHPSSSRPETFFF